MFFLRINPIAHRFVDGTQADMVIAPNARDEPSRKQEMKRSIAVHFQPDLIAGNAFVAPGAVVRGEVHLGEQSSIWFNAVVRGDTESIRVGRRSNIQDLCVVHADPGFPTWIGDDVTIGHAAVIHGATVHDGALVGIRAVVLNGAVVGAGSIVGAGAVVTEGTQIAPGQLVVGIPARAVREVTEADRQRAQHAAVHYVEVSEAYRPETGFGRAAPLG